MSEPSPAILVKILEGRECWYAFTDAGCSDITLAIGAKVPRSRTNPRFPEDHPVQFKGEYSLWVECAWRLDHKKAVVAVSGDYGSDSGFTITNGLRNLFGKRIRQIMARSPAWDLDVYFEDGYTLRVFSDVSEHNSRSTAWTLGGPNGFHLAIGPKGQWTSDGNLNHYAWEPEM